MEQELMVDSLEDLKDNNFNYYDSYHIDRIKSVINLEELQEVVMKQIKELEAQIEEKVNRWEGVPQDIQKECEVMEDLEELKNRIQGSNPLIKVKIRR